MVSLVSLHCGDGFEYNGSEYMLAGVAAYVIVRRTTDPESMAPEMPVVNLSTGVLSLIRANEQVVPMPFVYYREDRDGPQG